MNWDETTTIFAVPGKQVAPLSEEQGREIREAIKNKVTTKEEKERIAREVKILFTKPDRKKHE